MKYLFSMLLFAQLALADEIIDLPKDHVELATKMLYSQQLVNSMAACPKEVGLLRLARATFSEIRVFTSFMGIQHTLDFVDKDGKYGRFEIRRPNGSAAECKLEPINSD